MKMQDWIAVSLASVAYAVFAAWANRKFGERKRLKAMQEQMKKFQKEYAQAVKANDQAKLKELESRDKELMKMTKDMMLLPFKSMLVVLPAFLATIWLITPLFPNFAVTLPIGLHFQEILS
ncbi:MAG: EMC3/TMCO1 family protein, partial [Candidatus Norongarragalinales archaeon]